jgi:hypothetical protein
VTRSERRKEGRNNMELGNQVGVCETPTVYVEQAGPPGRWARGLRTLSDYIDGILAERTEAPWGEGPS